MKCPCCHTENVMHEEDECIDALVKQRDEAERALAKATEALRWYADPENNGKQEWVTIDSVDVPKYRSIDDDEGDAARAALLAIEDTTRDTDANRYHQSLGAKWMNEAIVAELRSYGGHKYFETPPDVIKRIERRWENEAFWRGGAAAKEKKDGG